MKSIYVISQQTQQRRADGGSTLNQRRVNMLCLLGYAFYSQENRKQNPNMVFKLKQ